MLRNSRLPGSVYEKNTRKGTLTATTTTGSSERPFPSCRYALSRNFPLEVGKTHSDTYCVLVVSSAFDVCNPAPASLSNDRGRREKERREGPCAEPK